MSDTSPSFDVEQLLAEVRAHLSIEDGIQALLRGISHAIDTAVNAALGKGADIDHLDDLCAIGDSLDQHAGQVATAVTDNTPASDKAPDTTTDPNTEPALAPPDTPPAPNADPPTPPPATPPPAASPPGSGKTDSPAGEPTPPSGATPGAATPAPVTPTPPATPGSAPSPPGSATGS